MFVGLHCTVPGCLIQQVTNYAVAVRNMQTHCLTIPPKIETNLKQGIEMATAVVVGSHAKWEVRNWDEFQKGRSGESLQGLQFN